MINSAMTIDKELDIKAIALIFAKAFDGEVIPPEPEEEERYRPPPKWKDREPSYLESECYYFADPPDQ